MHVSATCPGSVQGSPPCLSLLLLMPPRFESCAQSNQWCLLQKWRELAGCGTKAYYYDSGEPILEHEQRQISECLIFLIYVN